MNPKISIIIPVYNTEKYLDRCIESVRSQTLNEIEIILVDDGSTDSSPIICDKAADMDKRIIVIHKENEGQGIARNYGLDVAKGEYIGFSDSDDYVESDMFENLYNTAKAHNADIVLSGMYFVGGNMFDERSTRKLQSSFDKETFFEGAEGRKKLLLGIVGSLPEDSRDSLYGMSTCTNIYRLDTIKNNDVRFLSERKILSEDGLFNMDFIMHAERAVGITGAWYNYCRNGESVSKSYNPTRFERSMVFLAEIESRLSTLMNESEYRIYLNRLTQGFARILCSQEIMREIQEGISWHDVRERLKEICCRREIKCALKNYPWYRLPPKQAAFAFLVKYRLYFMQRMLVKLRS